MKSSIVSEVKEKNGMKDRVIYHIKDKAIWAVFLAIMVGFSLASPRFLSSSNLFIIMRQVSMYGIASVGMMFVILTGGIDLSTGSVITIVNVVCAHLMVKMGFGMVSAVLVSLLLSVFIGLLNGFMVATIRMPAIIATFASQIVFAGCCS
jgi:ribose transport system permease protein